MSGDFQVLNVSGYATASLLPPCRHQPVGPRNRCCAASAAAVPSGVDHQAGMTVASTDGVAYTLESSSLIDVLLAVQINIQSQLVKCAGAASWVATTGQENLLAARGSRQSRRQRPGDSTQCFWHSTARPRQPAECHGRRIANRQHSLAAHEGCHTVAGIVLISAYTGVPTAGQERRAEPRAAF